MANPHAHHHHAASDRDGVTDPVCSMSVHPRDKTPHVEYRGHDYYFCSEACRQKFLAEPDTYAGGEAASKRPETSASGKWTCPMHPQIIRDAPGSCPICGMALEPLMPSGAANPELKDMR